MLLHLSSLVLVRQAYFSSSFVLINKNIFFTFFCNLAILPLIFNINRLWDLLWRFPFNIEAVFPKFGISSFPFCSFSTKVSDIKKRLCFFLPFLHVPFYTLFSPAILVRLFLLFLNFIIGVVSLHLVPYPVINLSDCRLLLGLVTL